MFKRKKMSDEMFAELLQSVKEAVLIEKGEIPPARVFEIEPLDIAKIRSKKIGRAHV